MTLLRLGFIWCHFVQTIKNKSFYFSIPPLTKDTYPRIFMQTNRVELHLTISTLSLSKGILSLVSF